MFADIRILQREPDSHVAFELLFRAAEAVQELMQRRKWVVGVLREFLPRGSQLLGLNINGGRVICIRLRKHRSGGCRRQSRAARTDHQREERSLTGAPQRVRGLSDIPGTSASNFFAYEEILGTLLHELVHIEISAHNRAFYALLETLWEEVRWSARSGLYGPVHRLSPRGCGDGSCGSRPVLASAPATPGTIALLDCHPEQRRNLLLKAVLRRLEQQRPDPHDATRYSDESQGALALVNWNRPPVIQVAENDPSGLEERVVALESEERTRFSESATCLEQGDTCQVIQVVDLTVEDADDTLECIDLCATDDEENDERTARAAAAAADDDDDDDDHDRA
ncbi:hypothetical protein, conserved [Cyanidioschyzon merolae strain 10D]|uniref:WLM domain-containing protein n=1 Tax=Cyanidioschyzon merolae (strain NIES-3377 / 10D) TaxID=280699 RepID=M1VBI9_CYAM1|nr:hypothetical protein, conserved [Cyanidioschyzon merolae strain 10D]BAM82694.1 hypothetical protein, conserved [Cyanidioschyzon merolae strain 10D]|eukprot:XP_005538730.1 hypothetical protein, conserved [Cyanidioschyzon merolae strain 10D]